VVHALVDDLKLVKGHGSPQYLVSRIREGDENMNYLFPSFLALFANVQKLEFWVTNWDWEVLDDFANWLFGRCFQEGFSKIILDFQAFLLFVFLFLL